MGFLASIDLKTIFIAVGVLVVVIVGYAMVARMLRWIVKVPPNKAFLVYGIKTKTMVKILKRVAGEVRDGVQVFTTAPQEVEVNYRIVKGGSVIVIPAVHTYAALDLNIITIEVQVSDVLTTQAIPIAVDGIAQIRIGGDDVYIATAAEELLGKTPDEIRKVAQETLMGHLRAIIGTMTVEQVYKDREVFQRSVQTLAIDDLAGMGLEIKSFVIKDISDKNGYLEALGKPELQAKLKDARMATAESNREATLKEQTSAKAIAEYEKDTNVAKQRFEAEVATQRAIASRAEEISLAEQDKNLEEQKTRAAEQAARRRDMELDGEVRRPADADLYASQKTAEGVKITGFAAAEVTQRTGETEATVSKVKGLAAADVTKAQALATAEGAKATLLAEAEGSGAKLLAEAKGLGAKLLAEAEGQEKLAAALNSYGPAASRLVLGKELLGGVPLVAESFGKAIANIDQIRLIDFNNGGEKGEGGTVVDQFIDTLPNTLFKFLQGATALLGTPIDDLAVAYVTEEAKKHGVTVSPEVAKEIGGKVAKKVEELKEEPTQAPLPSVSEVVTPAVEEPIVVDTPVVEAVKPKRRRFSQ